jgi:hypothetical protein
MLVLIRHGQSSWNLENRFTGWWDVDLTEQGVQEAWAAGELMKAKGLDFDMTYTSFQSRAIKTLNLALTGATAATPCKVGFGSTPTTCVGTSINGLYNLPNAPFLERFLGDSARPRLSIGFGVNWNSPFGPLRIDVAKALLHDKGDDTKLVTFNVGTQF